MSEVPESRRVGRMAVNEVRALLERYGHIVQEVDGGNDHGEDLHVARVRDCLGEDTEGLRATGTPRRPVREGARSAWSGRQCPGMVRRSCQMAPRSTVTEKGAAALITPANISPPL